MLPATTTETERDAQRRAHARTAFARARRLARSPSARRTSRAARREYACRLRAALCRVCASARVRQIVQLAPSGVSTRRRDCAASAWLPKLPSSRRRVNTWTRALHALLSPLLIVRVLPSPPPTLRLLLPTSAAAHFASRATAALIAAAARRGLARFGATAARRWRAATSSAERAHLSVRVRHLQQHVRVVLLREGAPRPLRGSAASSDHPRRRAWRRRRSGFTASHRRFVPLVVSHVEDARGGFRKDSGSRTDSHLLWSTRRWRGRASRARACVRAPAKDNLGTRGASPRAVSRRVRGSRSSAAHNEHANSQYRRASSVSVSGDARAAEAAAFSSRGGPRRSPRRASGRRAAAASGAVSSALDVAAATARGAEGHALAVGRRRPRGWALRARRSASPRASAARRALSPPPPRRRRRARAVVLGERAGMSRRSAPRNISAAEETRLDGGTSVGPCHGTVLAPAVGVRLLEQRVLGVARRHARSVLPVRRRVGHAAPAMSPIDDARASRRRRRGRRRCLARVRLPSTLRALGGATARARIERRRSPSSRRACAMSLRATFGRALRRARARALSRFLKLDPYASTARVRSCIAAAAGFAFLGLFGSAPGPSSPPSRMTADSTASSAFVRRRSRGGRVPRGRTSSPPVGR